MFIYLKDSLIESTYENNIKLAQNEFNKTEIQIKKEIDHYRLILRVIKESGNFQQYIMDYDKNIENTLIHDFENYAKTNEDIFQVRYLDNEGMERIRVDKISGETYVAKNLQNKENRYYFLRTKNLKENQYYISDFDLNVENGEIEIPYKPTIRVSTPIYEGDKFLGILIINYNVKNLIDYISAQNIFNVYYMDNVGNFLLHPDRKKCWSTQLKTNYKVKDEIKNIDELKLNNYKDKNLLYYIDRVSITDTDFFIIYSVKKEIYEKEEKELENEIFMIFIIIFVVTFPIVIIGSYLQAFQMKILETLIDSLPFPIALKNRVGKFVLVNESLVSLYSFKNKESLLGKISYDFSSKNLPYTNKIKDSQALKKSKIKYEDILHLPSNSKELYFDTRLIKITFLGLFKKDFILGIAIDITELKELNNELEKRVKEELAKRLKSEQRLAQKTKLAEIGNLIDNIILQWEHPLNLISLNTQAIELEYETINKLDEENTLKRVETIKESTQFMFDTTADLKLFLSLDKGIELFSLSDIVNTVERILMGRLKKLHIDIRKEINEEIKIQGLKNEFSQVILNLINNSLNEFESSNKKYTKKDIFIGASITETFIVIKVEDNAKELPLKATKKIFNENFESENEDIQRKGLHICKGIINNIFKGTIEANSKNGYTVFEVKIPL
ncbi:ATP-binding protein [Halarcobacter ebronensis]|uniref:histidine kinase n=1 Tax=Halarcobacter ebronensis TaxID=1462615 RepID=A0A4Q1AWM1_9BACT|nr:ATP-binding protein [Halarcobacter ebronensis]QKF83250.1 PAS sensor-containing signal transduction histidine kinase [Halarcobacter ebronensis]RXK05115.1 hypothetical protein CRV07_08850 [Halarcobacter ebronensis]